jgi:membrane protein DedA with SNARE-associated domain
MIHVPVLNLDRPWVFLAVLGLSLIDGVFPLLPARTAVVALGVVARTGDLRAYPLIAAATVGAFISDNVSYWLGSRYGERVVTSLTAHGHRRQSVKEWAERTIRARGLPLIVLGRVIPGGPTLFTMVAGISHFPRIRFRLATAAGACLWSAYAFTMGLVGGTIVTDNPLTAFLVALGIAASLNLALMLGMQKRFLRGVIRQRRRRGN